MHIQYLSVSAGVRATCPQARLQAVVTIHPNMLWPQVFVDGRLVGGADKTLELLGSGKLQQLIRDAKQPVLPSELRALIQERQTTQQV